MKSAFKIKQIMMVVFSLAPGWTIGQIPVPSIPEAIAVTARPSHDSITLRWAPLNFNVWQLGNRHGYKIERYVIARNGTLVKYPEKIIADTLIKPFPEDRWESLVTQNKYAAIAAQALFGGRFELDLAQSDIFSIANKVNENEQRYTFSLFSADMSPEVAKASGLWYVDKHVIKGEKYLYRVVLINSEDTLRGSIFISPDDIYDLPKPKNLKADFHDQIVSLKWDKNNITRYTAYVVERSDDGKHFTSISDAPLVTVSPTESENTRYEYAIDSLKDLSKSYYYRVKGISPFGEESPASEIASGKGTPPVNQVPYISSIENIENKSLRIRWDFPEASNPVIKGFTVSRSSKPGVKLPQLSPTPLPPQTRSYHDMDPGPVNYYRVTAIGLDGQMYPSHDYFAQLIDSIPPSHPVGLKAKTDDDGGVSLSWQTNTESDIYGYRIYKGYHKSEELTQITSDPVRDPSFIDHVDLNTLNEAVYYAVMSIDKSQNHSNFSELLKVPLPDKVKPQAPVILPVRSDRHGVTLAWIPSSSEDVVAYTVYRRTAEKKEWERLTILVATNDTIYNFLDRNLSPDRVHHYTVVAIDDSGLESEPAYPVNGIKTDNALRPDVHWRKPVIVTELNQITLSWNYDQPDVMSFRIYKSVDGNVPILFTTLSSNKKEFRDILVPGQQYQYRIMALFIDGKKSRLSEEATFQY